MEPVRLGFIGCGSHAFRSHIKIAAAMPELFTIVAVHDINPEAMDRVVALAPAAKKTEGFCELLALPNVEAVVIGTPDQFHLEQAMVAVAMQKHVLCEKPLWLGCGRTEEEGLLILKQAEGQGLVFTSCHPRRFDPVYILAKDNLEICKAFFGNVIEFSYRFFYEKPSTVGKHISLLLDHFNHEIDLTNFILGPSPTNLVKHFDGHDRYHVAGYRGDAVALTFSGQRKLDEYVFWNELDITFEFGRFIHCSVLTRDGLVHPLSLEWDMDEKAPDICKIAHEPYAYSTCFTGLMRNFARSVRNLEPNYLTTEDLKVNTISGNQLVATGSFLEF